MNSKIFSIIMILVVLRSSLNRLRGSSWGKPYTSKGATSCATGLIAGACALWLGYGGINAALIVVTVWATVWFWAAPGWGKYFTVIHGRDMRHEREIAWIDWFDWVRSPLLRDFVQMSLRGVYLMPLPILLSFVAWPSSWSLVLCCLLQGTCYAVTRPLREEHRVPAAEFLMGALIGAIILTCLIQGAPHDQ